MRYCLFFVFTRRPLALSVVTDFYDRRRQPYLHTALSREWWHNLDPYFKSYQLTAPKIDTDACLTLAISCSNVGSRLFSTKVRNLILAKFANFCHTRQRQKHWDNSNKWLSLPTCEIFFGSVTVNLLLSSSWYYESLVICRCGCTILIFIMLSITLGLQWRCVMR